MKPDENLHLDEDQLIRAVVDETDLPGRLQEHLLQCPQCRTNKNRIEADLFRLGRMAERFSPSPLKKFSLPVEKPQKAVQWAWQWRTALGVAVTALLVISVISASQIFKHSVAKNEPIYTQEMVEDEEFTEQINVLAENALPREYLDIIGESESEPDETFMDFLVPAIEDESLTLNSGRRGGKSC